MTDWAALGTLRFSRTFKYLDTVKQFVKSSKRPGDILNGGRRGCDGGGWWGASALRKRSGRAALCAVHICMQEYKVSCMS